MADCGMRDQARALATKAAIEKANDLAAAAGMKVVGKPTSLTTYSYGGGSSFATVAATGPAGTWRRMLCKTR